MWAFERDDCKACNKGECNWERKDGGDALKAEADAGGEDV